MAVYQVQKDGNAPAGLKVGDSVNTAGGLYTIVDPGTPGSKFNPASGYASIKAGASYTDDVIASGITQSAKITQQSIDQAQKQMDYQTSSNAKAMAFSQAEAEKNRQFQKMMSDTSYQRSVKDLIEAGLNPVLALMQGGASTPPGANAQGFTSQGAKGDINESAPQILQGLLTALINQSTALDTAMLTSQAMLGSANIHARTQSYITDINNAFKEYLYDNYPQTVAGLGSSAAQKVLKVINGFTNAMGVGNFSEAMYNLGGKLFEKTANNPAYELHELKKNDKKAKK